MTDKIPPGTPELTFRQHFLWEARKSCVPTVIEYQAIIAVTVRTSGILGLPIK